MAKIVAKNVESDIVSDIIPIWQVVMLGAVLGLFYWFLTLVLNKYIGSLSVAGNIATILAATLGVILMLNLRMARPLLIAIAVAASLWGLSGLTNGLTEIEIALWSVLLYGLAYTLFFWLNRYKRLLPVLAVIVVVIVIARLAITF